MQCYTGTRPDVTTLSILCLGTLTVSVSAQSCLTIGGNVVGASCVFPFTYQGVQYNHCASVSEDGGAGQPWCSTGTDGNGNYITDIWGYCGTNCPLFKQTTDTSEPTDSTASTKNQLSTASTITDITGSSTVVNTTTKVPPTESSSVTNLPPNNTNPTSETTNNPTSGYSTTDASLTYYHNLTGYILQY